jgi:hypothetical protein
MKYIPFFSIVTLMTLSGCSSTEVACENVTTASEQVQACQSLQRQITNAKDRPIMRTELERRYQVDCVDIRYYRDDKQESICGNKHEVEEIVQATK